MRKMWSVPFATNCTMQHQLFLQQSLVKLSLDTRGKHPHISKLSAAPLLDLFATPTTFRRKHSRSLDPREQGGPFGGEERTWWRAELVCYHAECPELASVDGGDA